MPRYRIPKVNIEDDPNVDDPLRIAKVTSDKHGLTLAFVKFHDLPVVQHKKSGQMGRRAIVITDMRSDPNDSDWVICETKDVILPHNEQDLNISDQSDWTPV